MAVEEDSAVQELKHRRGETQAEVVKRVESGIVFMQSKKNKHKSLGIEKQREKDKETHREGNERLKTFKMRRDLVTLNDTRRGSRLSSSC